MDSDSIYMSPNYSAYEFKSKRIWRIDGYYEPFVYIIQEISSKIKYIGSKTQYSVEPCLESCLGTQYFTSSNYVKWKENPDSFQILKIYPCASNHDALILETELIQYFDAVNSDLFYNRNCNGANWSLSGRLGKNHPAYGCTRSKETREKMSLSKMGENNPWWNKKQSEEHRKKNSEANKGENNAMYGLRGENHPAYGYQHSEESIKKRIESRKGYKHSEETKKKIGDSRRGKLHSEETKDLIREKASGANNAMYGRNHSEETKKKLSKIAKNRPKRQCEHCLRYVSVCSFSRWHGDFCKHKTGT